MPLFRYMDPDTERFARHAASATLATLLAVRALKAVGDFGGLLAGIVGGAAS